MKSKAPLTLMEQLTMILIFALAAALCLQLFAFAGNLSSEGEIRDHAVTAVQNAAEAIKCVRGDPERLVILCGGESTENGWIIGYDEEWKNVSSDEADYTVEAMFVENGHPLLGSAQITAKDAKGKQWFQVAVNWQEERNE